MHNNKVNTITRLINGEGNEFRTVLSDREKCVLLIVANTGVNG